MLSPRLELGPFLSFEIEIWDGLGSELDNIPSKTQMWWHLNQTVGEEMCCTDEERWGMLREDGGRGGKMKED